MEFEEGGRRGRREKGERGGRKEGSVVVVVGGRGVKHRSESCAWSQVSGICCRYFVIEIHSRN